VFWIGFEEPDCEIDAISGASAGAVNGVLLVWFRRRRPRRRADATATFLEEDHGRGIVPLPMLIGGFSPAGTSVTSVAGYRGATDPFDLDPLRQALATEIDFRAA
jgi:NTE family protein